MQLHLRATLYERLSRAGLPASYYREDRGDGAIFVAPAHHAGSFLTPFADRLHAHLREHNAMASTRAQIRLRLALHVGMVHEDEQGIAGVAVNHVFRLLDAQPARRALESGRGDLVLIVSDRVYDDLVLRSWNADHYRPVDVRVKETTARAWLKAWD